MKNKIVLIFIAVLLSVCFVSAGLAMEKGNKRKGKYLYRKVWKACHERGEIDSPKPRLNPDDHTQAEWEAIFNQKNFSEFGCKEEWSAASEQDLADIFTHMYEHASDSPTPAKCN